MSRHRRPGDGDEPVRAARDDGRWEPRYAVPRDEPAGYEPPRPSAPLPRRPTPPLPSAARGRQPPRPAQPAQPPQPAKPAKSARAPRQPAKSRGRLRLRINPITCDGHGLCAELLPELLARDEWGYPAPIVAEVPVELETHAQRAAQQCPTLAVLLERRRPRPDPG